MRHAEWSEIDLDAAVWTIPANKMKMRRPHRVPLSIQALEILSISAALPAGANTYSRASTRLAGRWPRTRSVKTIFVIAIIDAGLLPFAAALPVILGANIGTTFSSQIFAWDVDRWSPLLLAAGLAWSLLARTDRAKVWGRALLGLGLVLFGLSEIGDAAASTTVAIQSSSAMMGIVITLAGGGLISLPAGVAIMLGAGSGPAPIRCSPRSAARARRCARAFSTSCSTSPPSCSAFS